MLVDHVLLQVVLQLRLVLAVRAHELRLLAALEAPMAVQIVTVPIVLATVATLERRRTDDGGRRLRQARDQLGAHARHRIDDALVDDGRRSGSGCGGCRRRRRSGPSGVDSRIRSRVGRAGSDGGLVLHIVQMMMVVHVGRRWLPDFDAVVQTMQRSSRCGVRVICAVFFGQQGGL